MGSGKEEPVLREGNMAWLVQPRLIFSRVVVVSAISFALLYASAVAQPGDSKKPGAEPDAASGSRSAMGEPASRQTTSAQNLPSPEKAKSSTTGKGLESPGKSAPAKLSAPETQPVPEKSSLPFPVISSDSVTSVTGVQPAQRTFPSAIDIHGSAAGVLLHARRDTKYDLLSPLSIWLEEGPLLVSVRHPSEMVLVATKFGDVVVTAGGVALVERGEEDTLRIINLSTNNETVFLNMHDKLWTNSPWGHVVRVQHMGNNKNKKARKKTAYESVESGAVSVTPGYELVLGGRLLTMDDVKPPDSTGRRDFKVFEGGRIVIDEISIDHLTQLHDLIKNLNAHGEKASSVYQEIMKSAGLLKARQGETGFEKVVPAPPKPPEPRRKPPSKVPPPPGKPPAVKPKTSIPPMPTPAPAKGGSSPTGTAPAKPDSASGSSTAKPAQPAAKSDAAQGSSSATPAKTEAPAAAPAKNGTAPAQPGK